MFLSRRPGAVGGKVKYMGRKYNREQKEYIETKKALEALEARERPWKPLS